MKNIRYFLPLLALAFFMPSVLNGQSARFKPASRNPVVNTPQQLSPVMAFQPVLPLKSNPLANVGGYLPRKINPSAHRLNPDVFTAVSYDRHGRLVFAEGRIPDAISFKEKSGGQVVNACFQFLEQIREPLYIDSPVDEFVLNQEQTDELGMVHLRFQQVFHGIPVYGGEAYLHGNQGFIDRFNGYVYPTPVTVQLTPALQASVAIQSVVAHVSGETVYRELSQVEKQLLKYDAPVSELVIYHKNKETDQEKLAWHITIRPNLIERWEYFINAMDGSLIHFYNNTQTDGDVLASGNDLNGVNQTFHVYLEAGTYYMVDISKPMFNAQSFEGVIKSYDAFNAPYNQVSNASIVTSPSNSWAANAISAHYHASVSYDYWKNVHNRNSYNNQGASIINVINITSENGQGFDNAFWSGQAMFYGNGGNYFKPLAGALDVCAHELGHAVDETSANLEYQYESGAINESYSDIIGAMVERVNWKIGEDIMKPGVSGFPSGAMRDMSNPHNGGSSFDDPCYQPAHVSEKYTGSQDNGGVHINSGIGNYAYYLYAQAVGLEKGEKTFMRALFNYLTRSSQFIDFRLAVIQAAKDLYGNQSAEVTAAGNAFDAVGITDGSGSGGGGTTAPGNLQTNPGQDYILLLDEYEGDQYTLFISNTTGTQFTPISETLVKNKPSILDDGSAAVFISGDSKMRAISLSGQPNETVIQGDPIWEGVSISKDGSLISAVTNFQDSSIYVYSYDRQEWARFPLYNPGTQTGVNTYNVLFADAMEWLYDGEYIMYDAFSRMSGPSGQTIEFWDINFIRVWNKAANTWGDGQIFKMMSGLDPGISIGNPSLTKNSTYIAAFDMFDENSGDDYILAVNLDNGDIGEVFSNGQILGTPNYSKLDDHLIFTTLNGSREDIAVIGMQPDKIHPSGNAVSLIPAAKWGIWYAQGVRALAIDEPEAVRNIRIFPNPTDGIVNLDIDNIHNESLVISLLNLQGQTVFTRMIRSTGNQVVTDFSHLTPGIYFLRVTGSDFSAGGKIIIR